MGIFPSVWTDYYHELPLEEAVQRLAQAGFRCAEISGNHTRKLLERDGTVSQVGHLVHRFLRQQDFRILQGHLSYKKGLCDPTATEDLKRELDLFLELGVENAVIHANGGAELPEEERFSRRVAALSQLAEYVKGTPIRLCLENLGSVPETRTVEKLRVLMDAVGSDRLGICLDTGHLHLTNGREQTCQSHEEFIEKAGKDLHALHITNNSGAGDDHLMPFSSRQGVDWQPVVAALRRIGYRGLFNLEILGENKAPLYIRDAKLDYIKKMTDYMLSDQFLDL